MINPKEIYKLRKEQSKMQKQMEQIFSSEEKHGVKIVVRGDRKIEAIYFEEEEQKDLRDLINSAMKAVNKKVEKQLRGQLSELGFPGL